MNYDDTKAVLMRELAPDVGQIYLRVDGEQLLRIRRVSGEEVIVEFCNPVEVRERTESGIGLVLMERLTLAQWQVAITHGFIRACPSGRVGKIQAVPHVPVYYGDIPLGTDAKRLYRTPRQEVVEVPTGIIDSSLFLNMVRCGHKTWAHDMSTEVAN